MTIHPVATAFPDGATSGDAIRQNLADAFPLVLKTAAAIQAMDFSQVGAVVTPTEVRLNGVTFLYDATDQTSTHNGVTVLVSQDNKRFIAEIHPGAFTNVLSVLNDPPGSPSIGDKHIVGPAPGGDYASNANNLTVYTDAGWRFTAPVIGQHVYDRSAKSVKHWSEDAAWVAGLGADSVADQGITPSKMLWPFGARVEAEQATPPPFDAQLGTPAEGTLYLVAANGTDDFLNQDTKIAEADGAGGWKKFHNPYIGMRLFNADANNDILFTAAGWTQNQGALVFRDSKFVVTGALTVLNVGGNYSYSAATPPDTTFDHTEDAMQIAHTARNASSRLKFTYTASEVDSGGVGTTIALFRDAEADALDWVGGSATITAGQVSVDLETIAGDTSEHTYKIRLFGSSPGSPTRRRLQIEEFAQASPEAVASVTQIGVTSGDTDSIIIPAAAAAGDLCLVFNRAHNNGGNTITSVTPAGFTLLDSISDSSGNSRIRSNISAKILDGTEAVVDAIAAGNWVAVVFRFPDAITAFAANSISQTNGGGDPAAQTITALGETDLPIILFGMMTGRGGTAVPGGVTTTPGMDLLTSNAIMAAHVKVYESGPVNHTYDMNGDFERHTMQSGYLTFS